MTIEENIRNAAIAKGANVSSFDGTIATAMRSLASAEGADLSTAYDGTIAMAARSYALKAEEDIPLPAPKPDENEEETPAE